MRGVGFGGRLLGMCRFSGCCVIVPEVLSDSGKASVALPRIIPLLKGRLVDAEN